jgi:hypothetical protein
VHAFIQRARENLGRVVDSQNRIYCSFNRLLTGPTGLLLLVEAVNRPVGASLLLIDENGWLLGAWGKRSCKPAGTGYLSHPFYLPIEIFDWTLIF